MIASPFLVLPFPLTLMFFRTRNGRTSSMVAHDLSIAMQDKEPAPGRPRVDVEAVRAAVDGNAPWKHDKYEDGPRRNTMAKGRGASRQAASGYRLCDAPTP